MDLNITATASQVEALASMAGISKYTDEKDLADQIVASADLQLKKQKLLNWIAVSVDKTFIEAIFAVAEPLKP